MLFRSVGSVHVVVTDLSLDLNGDESLTLHLPFDRTSAAVQSPAAITICPLDGMINIKIPLSLAASGSTRQLTALTASATVTIDYSTAANQAIANALNGLPLTPTQFKDLALQRITSFVKSTPNPNLPLDRKSTRLNSSHSSVSRMPSSA